MVAFEKYGCGSGAVLYDVDAHNEVVLASLTTATWQKSSRSACNGNCVEVAALHHDLIGVRDSKDASHGPMLVFDVAAWGSFLDRIKKKI